MIPPPVFDNYIIPNTGGGIYFFSGLLENDGVAHVALISRNNEKLAEELLAEQDVILQEFYFPEPSDEETEEMAGDGEAEDPETDAAGETGEEPASGEEKESGKETGTSGENSPDKEGDKEENKT